MTQSIVIYGPQGCGKTMNGQRLARHFGLTTIIDEGANLGPFRWNKPLPSGTLFLAIDPPPAHVAKVAHVLKFDEAMRLAGFSRVSH